MSDAICDPQDAAPVDRGSGFWARTLCLIGLLPVVGPPKALAPGDGLYAIESFIALIALLFLLRAFWPTVAFAQNTAVNRPGWTKSGILHAAFAEAAWFFCLLSYDKIFVFLDGDWSPRRVAWNLLIPGVGAVVAGGFNYARNRRKLGRPVTVRPMHPTRRVHAWPVWLERGVVLAAPYALAVAATVLTAAGWLPSAPSPYLGWSSVAVVALAWTLPSLAAWLVAQVVILPLVPVSVQAQRCGFGLRHLSTEKYLLHYGLPWAGCLGLVTAEIMSGRPFWSLSPAMWLWAIPGVLAGSSGAYMCAASSAQADRG